MTVEEESTHKNARKKKEMREYNLILPLSRSLIKSEDTQFIERGASKHMSGVARKSHLLLTRSFSLGLNGLDLEQMSDNKDGRLPLKLVDI